MSFIHSLLLALGVARPASVEEAVAPLKKIAENLYALAEREKDRQQTFLAERRRLSKELEDVDHARWAAQDRETQALAQADRIGTLFLPSPTPAQQ